MSRLVQDLGSRGDVISASDIVFGVIIYDYVKLHQSNVVEKKNSMQRSKGIVNGIW